MVGVAQLVRAPGCGPGGRGFDSHHSPHILALQRFNGPIAQLAEHRTLNPQVEGSIPSGRTLDEFQPSVIVGSSSFVS